VANNGGLALYEELLQQIKELAINNEQLTIRCFFEIDPSQSSRITSLIQSHIPAARIEIKKDLDGQDRVVCVELT
jgi:methylase of polypeptide subunit release factors